MLFKLLLKVTSQPPGRTYTDDKGNILPTNATEADKEAYKLAKGCNDYIANVTYLPPGEPQPVSFNKNRYVLGVLFYWAALSLSFRKISNMNIIAWGPQVQFY